MSGLHVSAEEADAWLGILERGNDVEPPECHVRYGRPVDDSTMRFVILLPIPGLVR